MTSEDEPFRIQADFCKAMAHPVRLRIIDLLKRRPSTVTEIVRAIRVSQANASQHLAVLRARGVVRAERRGNGVVYSLADRRVISALDLLRTVMTDNLLQKTALVDLLMHAQS